MTTNDKNPPTATLHDNTKTPRDVRRARGLALRATFPLKDHAEVPGTAGRSDPMDLLEKDNSGRIKKLIPIRYGRMSRTPFTFFRGAASVMAADLKNTCTTNVPVQLCGDAHILNFGAFATPERNVVFDLNDFDETLPGSWEWDLKRLTTSLVLVARDNGMKAGAGGAAAEACTRAYRDKMHVYSKMSIMDIWYDKFDWEKVVADANERLRKTLLKDLKKAQKHTIASHYFPKLTEKQGGKYLFIDQPPLIYHDPNSDFEKKMRTAFEDYKNSLQEDKQRLLDRYTFVDAAIKVVGVGSVGTYCAIVLLMGPDEEPLILQIKEARRSVYEPYIGTSEHDTHGKRVVAGQRIIQSASDIFLGWMKTDKKDFYVRQLRDTKVKLTPEDWDETHLMDMATLTGEVLARAHARSGDPAVIAAYIGETDEFDGAISAFSVKYADRTEKDWELLAAAIKSGKLEAEEESGH
jgi:uncharacterized protein (DUF2252 family)